MFFQDLKVSLDGTCAVSFPNPNPNRLALALTLALTLTLTLTLTLALTLTLPLTLALAPGAHGERAGCRDALLDHELTRLG